ncbi:MAG: NERD domain-containing protein [Coleofasciculus sp. Co-bin14]|nr:NERD domain-containing protein [Coleofasciculus sp. Co-bin14]
MAKLYYCNNGHIELRHETLQELRAMPESWTVLLNCCPAGKNVDREIDALVITQKALHLIEFKYRTAPVHIKTESYWLAGNYEVRNSQGESPKEQVTNTEAAFKQWLEQTVPKLKQHTLPWVVLELHNNSNGIGTDAFRPGYYQMLGHVMVLSGVEKLTGALQRRENSAKNLSPQAITAENRAQLIQELGAKQLDTMTVQGRVVSLEENRPLPYVPIHIHFQGASKSNLNFDPLRYTDENGYFEFNGVPLQSFSLDIENDGSWQVLPTGIRQPAGIVIAPIFLAKKGMSEKLIQELEEMMLQLRINIEAGARRESDIEEEMKRQQTLLSNLIEAFDKNEAVITQLQKQLIELEAELKKIKQKLENQLTSAAVLAHKKWIEEKDRIEKARKLLALRVEALKWSAIVGAAGGLIALQPIPFADNLILTPMQIGLVIWIGKLYKRDLTSDLALKIMGSVGFGFFAQHATVLAYKLIPGAWGLGAITVPVFTVFLGLMMSLYFENGYFPDKSEQKQLFKSVQTALTDKELLAQMKTLGSVLVQEIQAKGYRIKPEDMRGILAKLGDQGKEIGERLAQLLGFNTP